MIKILTLFMKLAPMFVNRREWMIRCNLLIDAPE